MAGNTLSFNDTFARGTVPTVGNGWTQNTTTGNAAVANTGIYNNALTSAVNGITANPTNTTVLRSLAGLFSGETLIEAEISGLNDATTLLNNPKYQCLLSFGAANDGITFSSGFWSNRYTGVSLAINGNSNPSNSRNIEVRNQGALIGTTNITSLINFGSGASNFFMPMYTFKLKILLTPSSLRYKAYAGIEPPTWNAVNIGDTSQISNKNVFAISLYSQNNIGWEGVGLRNLKIQSNSKPLISYSLPEQTGNKITIASAMAVADTANENPTQSGLGAYLG